MSRDEKEIWIKAWLMRFGNRDNETFNWETIIDGREYGIMLQYSYDWGYEIDEQLLYRTGSKLIANSVCQMETDIIDKLIESL